MLSNFSNTFQDDLLVRDLHVGPDEKIYYKLPPDVNPANIARARPIPVEWRQEADLLIRNLLNSRIIERVPHCTQCCSAGGFVPSGSGLRLVTDYRQLNCCVRRPYSPFPDVETLKTNIPGTTRFIAKLDYSSGYFQVGLYKGSRDLSTFIVPQGRFHYRRSPMGLSSSGDLFINPTIKIIENLPGMQAMVDDIIISDDTFTDLIDRLYSLFLKLEENHATVSIKKILFG